ncbi:MFS transporter [Arthrobacter sp. Soc17.1.1.1]|uniref:MFS transporter n=1 Tax=Arthrobacter sp. Soc17.1.1.1 TaxID=3121277 RepID=UPI002FE4396B
MPGREASRRGVRQWRNALLVAFALGGFALSSWATRLPALREDLALDNAQLGLVLLAPTIGSAVGLVGAPALLRLLGARTALLVTVVAMSVGMIVAGGGAGAASVPVFFAGLGIAGFGVGATDILINIDGAAVERLAHRSLLPLLHAAWPAGAVVGAGVGAVCAAAGVAPSVQLIALALIVLVAGVLMVRAVPAGSRGLRRRYGTTSGLRRRAGSVLDPRLVAIGAVMFAAEFGEGAANSWLSVAVRDAFGQPDAFAAGVVGVYAAAQVVIRVAGGPLVDRFGRVRVIRVTMGLGAAGVLLMVLDLGTAPGVAGIVLWSVGVSMGFPLGMSAAAEGPGGAARVSVVGSLGYIANLVSPPLIGFLASGFDILTAFWPLVGLFVVSVLLAPALRPLRDAPGPAPGR